MSHTIKSATQLRFEDYETLKKVGEKLRVEVKKVQDFVMYDGNKVSGIAIYLKGWRYPAILTKDNVLLTDTYNGAWGNKKELEKFQNHFMAQTQMDYLNSIGINYEVEENENEIELIIND